MSNVQGDIPGVMENPIMGRPYVVVESDPTTYRVRVLSHCRRYDEATHLLDHTKDPDKIERTIVKSDHLTTFLGHARRDMAARMERDLGVT